MLIGELAHRTGLSRDTIRFYERAGLIRVGKHERQTNNYKQYSDTILRRLLAVKSLKGFGFTLSEIQELIEWWEADLFTCTEGKPQIEQKIAVIDQKIAQLLDVKARLQSAIVTCPEQCAVRDTLQQITQPGAS